MTTLIDPRVLRVPEELTLTHADPQRVLVVGSCLSETWAHGMKHLPNPCDSELYLLGLDLPAQPSRPIADYDFQLVQLALRFILPDAAFARLEQADLAGHEALFSHAVDGMRRFLERAMRWNREHGLLTFVIPFITPLQNPVGRLLPRYDLRNPVYFIEKLNETLAQDLTQYGHAYFFDINEIHAFHGKRYVQEDFAVAINHGGYLSNFDFDHDADRLETAGRATDFFESRVQDIFVYGWRELVSLYRSIRQIDMVKMVVIDLDDTLWRGVIAEGNTETLPTTEGWPKGFWEALLFLRRRGILLAIISKNEDARIVQMWHRIVGQDLSLDDFAIRRINWRAKAENMADILAQVNLLPRNIVYIDDNPAERAAITAAFPEMRALGGTPLTWRRILLWSAETQVAAITAESGARGAMMRAQVLREEERQAVPREAFLAGLDVRMTMFRVDDASHPRFPRVLELINKTNQFNTTGYRWTRAQCVGAMASGVAFHAFEVADRYTEYGLVGVLILDGTCLRQFVMSCRILGLEAEVAALAEIGRMLAGAGHRAMSASMIATDFNQPCRNLYAQSGFSPTEPGWSRNLAPPIPPPSHIALTITQAHG